MLADLVLSDRLMAASMIRPGPWATAVDNTPRRLLQPCGFRVCAGVLESRRHTWMGATSLSAMPVQCNLHIGKVPRDKHKPPNIMTSY